MRILVVTQYYYPEIGAASKRLTELTRLWNQKGYDIHIYTAIPNYPQGVVYAGYKENKFLIEDVEGIKIFRNPISMSKFKFKFKLLRIKNYFSFLISCFRNIRELPEDYDVVITSIGPVFSGLVGHYIARKKRVPHILEFRDITFKSLEATNYTNKYIIKLMKKLEINLCKKAQHVVTVTETYKDILACNGIEESKITCIPNGYLFDKIAIQEKDSDIGHILDVIRAEKEKNKKIIGYFGTLGISQEIEKVVKKFSEMDNYLFLVIGSGARENYIRELAKERENVFIFSSIPQNLIQYLYSQVDFNLIKILNDEAFSGTIPSKLFEIIGNNGVPLYLGPKGDAQRIIDSIHPSLYHSEINSMFSFLENNQLSPEEVINIKGKGELLVSHKYNREHHADMYIDLIKNL